MKVVLDRKYLVDMTALGSIVEVEEIGDYMNRHYKVKGEPECFEVVPDSKVVDGDDAVRVEEEHAAVKLKKAEAELAALKLDKARREFVDSVLAEKRGISRDDAVAFAAEQIYDFALQGKTSDDVRKWLRAQKETKGASQ